jgi:hypothetical protein
VALVEVLDENGLVVQVAVPPFVAHLEVGIGVVFARLAALAGAKPNNRAPLHGPGTGCWNPLTRVLNCGKWNWNTRGGR